VGAGRQRKEDTIDLAVGIDFATQIGATVEADGVVARVLANDDAAARRAGDAVLAALEWSDGPVEPPPLVHAAIGVQLSS
jgi:thymidine phosphorylase